MKSPQHGPRNHRCHSVIKRKSSSDAYKNRWEVALKPEGKYSIPIVRAYHSPVQERRKRISIRARSPPTALQANVINRKIKIKQKAPFSLIMIKDQSKWISFLAEPPGLKTYNPIYWQCPILFWRFGGRKGRRKKKNDPIGQVGSKPWQSGVAHITMTMNYWNWKIVTRREDKRVFFHSN